MSDHNQMISIPSDCASHVEAWFLGRRYPLIFRRSKDSTFDGATIHFDEANECFVVSHKSTNGEITRDQLTGLLKRFYTKETKRRVEGMVRLHQNDFSKKVKAISMKDSLSFWGQCNGKQELTFHWRLSMVSLDVMEYVVIHEMCHMMHLNHDRSFWRLVGKHCLNYEEKQDLLAWYERQLM